MRTTFLALALAILVTGCTTPNKIQPAPKPFRDHKTPIALEKPTLSQRIVEQRHQAGEVAGGKLAVDGQLLR